VDGDKVENGTEDVSVHEYLQDLVLDSEDVGQFLNEFARFAAKSLSGTEAEILCGVTLLRRKSSATVASSSEHAKNMDEIQYQFGDGPCLRAARQKETIYVADLESDDRWHDYADAVLQHGIRSVLAIPIPLDGEADAGLNLYSHVVDNFDEEAIKAAETFAGQASKGLSLSVRLTQQAETAAHLKAAMESRTTIDLAVGIIMGQNRCSQDRAFEILRSASSSRNVKLRDIAAGIVASTGQSDPATHFDP
jgi:GAF domain-containing protein